MFKTFFVEAKHPEKGKEVREIAEGMGFSWDDSNPDFVISLGGDGTYLISERKRPGVPKFLARDSLRCAKCHNESIDEMLQKIKDGKTSVMEITKLEASYKNHKLVGVNDVVIRNVDPRKALRFKLRVNDDYVSDDFIADGLVVSTPFGSTGYYHAMCRETFHEGIGIAFNNPVKRRKPIVLPLDSEVVVELTRGEAHLVVDNNAKVYTFGAGEKVKVVKSSEVAKLIVD